MGFWAHTLIMCSCTQVGSLLPRILSNSSSEMKKKRGKAFRLNQDNHLDSFDTSPNHHLGSADRPDDLEPDSISLCQGPSLCHSLSGGIQKRRRDLLYFQKTGLRICCWCRTLPFWTFCQYCQIFWLPQEAESECHHQWRCFPGTSIFAVLTSIPTHFRIKVKK